MFRTIAKSIGLGSSDDEFIMKKVSPHFVLSDHYILEKEMGKGTFSTVYAALDITTNAQVAIKAIEKGELNIRQKDRLRQEIGILFDCTHPNIIELLAAHENHTDIYIVTELMEGGEFFDYVVAHGRMEESDARHFIVQLVSAIDYLHRNGIVHRDVKPENILLKEKDCIDGIKLADFGFAIRIAEDETMSTPCGTPGYLAPELANFEHYTKSVDMWSVGVILYTLLSGYLPFYDDDDEKLVEMVARGHVHFPARHWSSVSRRGRDIVMRLLQKDSQLRLSAAEFLRHPWVLQGRGVHEDDVAEAEVSLHKSHGSIVADIADDVDGYASHLAASVDHEHAKQSMRRVLNVHRQGVGLKSASESSVWKRRHKK